MHGDVVEGPGHFDEVVDGEGLEAVAVGGSVLSAFAHDVLEGLEFCYAVVVVNHQKPWRNHQNYDTQIN